MRLSLLLALAVPAVTFAADPKPEELKTARYDVADLRKSSSGKTDTAEQIAAAIAGAVEPDAWKVGAKSGHRIRIVGEDALEIRTTTANHKQIAEVLQALRAVNDLAVNLTVSVFAIDHKVYEKKIRPKLKTGPLVPSEGEPSDIEMGREIESGRKPDATLTKHLRSGQSAVMFTDKRAITFRMPPHRWEAKEIPEPKVEFEGVTLSVRVAVSSDRRFVTVTTTETIRAVSELKTGKREIVPDKPLIAGVNRKPEEVELQSVRMRQEKITEERFVADTDCMVLPLRYVSPDPPKKVLVAVVRPTIYIQSEEDERSIPQGKDK